MPSKASVAKIALKATIHPSIEQFNAYSDIPFYALSGKPQHSNLIHKLPFWVL